MRIPLLRCLHLQTTQCQWRGSRLARFRPIRATLPGSAWGIHLACTSQVCDVQHYCNAIFIVVISSSLLRLSYGSTSTQRKGVYRPITSLQTLLASTARAWRAPTKNVNLASKRRSSKSCDWTIHLNPTQSKNRFTTALKCGHDHCIVSKWNHNLAFRTLD